MPSPKAFRKVFLDYLLGALIFFIAAIAVHWLITGRVYFFQNDTGSKTSPGGVVENGPFDDPTLLLWATEPDKIAAGQARYIAFCSACHAENLTATQDGEPLPALSLADGDWKYGSRPTEIFKLIKDGTPPGANGHNGLKMLPWGETLTSQQIGEVVAYIISQNTD